MVYNGLIALRRWFLPKTCLACGGRAGTDEFCDPCRAALPRLGPCCVRCAIPLPGTDTERSCGRCLTRPPHFERAHAVYRYEAPIDRLVQGFKYRRRLDWGRVLGDALIEHVRDARECPDAIVPVPLHRRRLRERGYNQSLELARPIGRALDIPVLAFAVRRVRPTPAQAGLNRDERRRNVRNAFDVVQPHHVLDRHIAIVDDVMTSGHTADALARALKRAGAAKVSVWMVARA
ncbi:MAG: ComF family protein [Gammaproteobacteria bacterium]